MIIVLKPGTTPAEVDHVLQRIHELGLKPHVSTGEHRTIIGVIGDENKLQAEPLQAIPGGELAMIAGPCAIENVEILNDIAGHVKKAGANILRGGAFKPRTSPYSFQG